MARVTVEDCINLVPNRFDLVMLAAQRARDINDGALLQVSRENDKLPVIALREIAGQKLNLSDLQENLIRGHQRMVEGSENEDDLMAFMETEEGFIPALGDSLDNDDMGDFNEVDEDLNDIEIGDED